MPGPTWSASPTTHTHTHTHTHIHTYTHTRTHMVDTANARFTVSNGCYTSTYCDYLPKAAFPGASATYISEHTAFHLCSTATCLKELGQLDHRWLVQLDRCAVLQTSATTDIYYIVNTSYRLHTKRPTAHMRACSMHVTVEACKDEPNLCSSKVESEVVHRICMCSPLTFRCRPWISLMPLLLM